MYQCVAVICTCVLRQFVPVVCVISVCGLGLCAEVVCISVEVSCELWFVSCVSVEACILYGGGGSYPVSLYRWCVSCVIV